MTTKKIKVAFVRDLLEIPAMEVPYPEPLQDVSKIVYNGYTTSGTEGKRIFVPKAMCRPTSEPPVPKHQTGCSNCGCVWDWFYRMGGFNGPPNYCPRCGAMNEDTDVWRLIGAAFVDGDESEG